MVMVHGRKTSLTCCSIILRDRDFHSSDENRYDGNAKLVMQMALRHVFIVSSVVPRNIERMNCPSVMKTGN